MRSRDELLRLVEWLEAHAAVEADSPYCNHHVENLCSEAAAAIRGLLEQEPVAWLDPNASDHDDAAVLEAVHKNAREHGAMTWWKRYTVPLYALPVAAPAQEEK